MSSRRLCASARAGYYTTRPSSSAFPRFTLSCVVLLNRESRLGREPRLAGTGVRVTNLALRAGMCSRIALVSKVSAPTLLKSSEATHTLADLLVATSRLRRPPRPVAAQADRDSRSFSSPGSCNFTGRVSIVIPLHLVPLQQRPPQPPRHRPRLERLNRIPPRPLPRRLHLPLPTPPDDPLVLLPPILNRHAPRLKYQRPNIRIALHFLWHGGGQRRPWGWRDGAEEVRETEIEAPLQRVILRCPDVYELWSFGRVPSYVRCEVGEEGERLEFEGGVVERGRANDFPDRDAVLVDSRGETFGVRGGGEEEAGDDGVRFVGAVESYEVGDESADVVSAWEMMDWRERRTGCGSERQCCSCVRRLWSRLRGAGESRRGARARRA